MKLHRGRSRARIGPRRLTGNGRTRDRGARVGLESLEKRALLAVGLVAAYDFGEASGSTVLDASGTGNNGTIVGGTRTSAGKNGAVLDFDGTSSKVTIPDSTSLHLTTGMTLEAWLRPTAAGAGWTTAVLKERLGGLAYAALCHRRRRQAPRRLHRQERNRLQRGRHHGAGSEHLDAPGDDLRRRALRLYVNGVLAKSRTLSGTIIASAAPLDIGGNGVWGEYFKGQIDDVRVYNRALSAAEVQTDMNTPVSGTPDTTAPTVALTGPSAGSTVSGTVTVSATASDNVGVAGVQFLSTVPAWAPRTPPPRMPSPGIPPRRPMGRIRSRPSPGTRRGTVRPPRP